MLKFFIVALFIYYGFMLTGCFIRFVYENRKWRKGCCGEKWFRAGAWDYWRGRKYKCLTCDDYFWFSYRGWSKK